MGLYNHVQKNRRPNRPAIFVNFVYRQFLLLFSPEPIILPGAHTPPPIS